VVACASGLFGGLGEFLATDLRTPRSTYDVVCIAGGDSGPRAEHAFALYRAGRTRRILFLSRTPGLYAAIPPYAAWDSASILNAGVVLADVFFDSLTRNTREEVLRIGVLCEKHHWRSVGIISDPPHTRRLARLCNDLLSSSRFQWYLDPASLSTWRTEKWWNDRVGFEYGIREAAKNVIDVLWGE
jgi:uncharacterized SAM-binding protein YcdF (DUF218 family)